MFDRQPAIDCRIDNLLFPLVVEKSGSTGLGIRVDGVVVVTVDPTTVGVAVVSSRVLAWFAARSRVSTLIVAHRSLFNADSSMAFPTSG